MRTVFGRGVPYGLDAACYRLSAAVDLAAADVASPFLGALGDVVGDPQELIISGHSSTDLFDDDAVAGRRHLMGRCADVGVCAAAG